MINIRLSDDIFNTGKPFHNTQRNRASILIGAGRNDLPVAKKNNYPLASLDYYGFQTGLYITARGTEIDDEMLETLVKDGMYRASYGVQLIDLTQKGYIEIAHDGAILTSDQLVHFTA